MSIDAPPVPHLIVIGFGVPGRAVADEARRQHLDVVVVEKNAQTVKRCHTAGVRMIVGDARDPLILKQAEINRAAAIVVAIPDEEAALQVTRLARALNAQAKILTRCHFTSAGFQAKDAGADEVVVAETVVAAQMSTVLKSLLPQSNGLP
jgi:CPA2 family monovalent cation:H+ antiporter-2